MISDNSFFLILKNLLIDSGLPEDRVSWFLKSKKKTLVKDIVDYYKRWERENYSNSLEYSSEEGEKPNIQNN